MGSDWIYYTDIRPRRKRTDGEEGNNDYKNEFMKSFDSFLEECKLPISELSNHLANKDVYKHVINTDKINDMINNNSDYHVRFLKSRFLSNPKFKRELIDYYNPIGYFVCGPTKIDDNKWIIDFSSKIGYN